MEENSVCSILLCGKPLYGKQPWCSYHYKKFRSGPECSAAECKSVVVGRGYCKKHYVRWQKYGNAEEPRHTALPGEGNIDNGYRRFGKNVDGKFKLVREHRLVMEEILGRPLLPGENVHHKNGIRSDNRPENLELWTKKQPCGQRVEDQVNWALELLALYAPEKLAKP